MKKEIFILVIVLLVPLISSIEIQMPSEISQGQTVIAKVSGNFLDPILLNNIEFYRGHTQTSFDYSVGKIGNDYYIYFQTLSKPQNNYSVLITGVRYYVGAQISNKDIEKNFSVTFETSDFKINPGFVITDRDFSISVQNLKSEIITINLNTEINFGSSQGFFDFLFNNQEVSSSESIEILSGETEDIDISLNGINETTIRTITLSSENTEYEIPVYLILELSSEESSNETGQNQTDEEQNETFTEEKNESENGSFWDIFKKENKTKDAEEKTDSGYTVAEDENGNQILIDEEGNIVEKNVSIKTCEELKGEKCVVDEEVCDGKKIDALDGECCIGTCEKKEKSKNQKIIGWAILGLIVILLIWFKTKFNKTRRRKFNLPGIDKRRY